MKTYRVRYITEKGEKRTTAPLSKYAAKKLLKFKLDQGLKAEIL